MIVSCPSCGTRYRVDALAGGDAERRRCSACDALVPIEAAPRPYVLVPQAAATAGWPGPSAGPTLPGQARAGVRTAPPSAASPRRRIEAPSGVGESAEDTGAWAGAPELRRREPLDGTEPVPSSGTTLQVIAAAVLGGLGAAAGHQIAGSGMLDAVPLGGPVGPAVLGVAGAAFGLWLGWAAARWMTPRH